MLNSKYAPVLALGVLGVIAVLAIGWFLAVKPQIDAAAQYHDDAQKVRANIDAVKEKSAALEQWRGKVKLSPEIAELADTHFLADFDTLEFQRLLINKVRSSAVDIYVHEISAPRPIDGWVVPPAQILSNQVVGLFETGPVQVESDELGGAFQPVVTGIAAGEPAVNNLYGFDTVISVTGDHQQIASFLAQMHNPDDRFMLIHRSYTEQRASNSPPIATVRQPTDGDMMVTISGTVFWLDPTVPDYESQEITPAAVGETSGALPKGSAPVQPTDGVPIVR